jgi:hypothetical protein
MDEEKPRRQRWLADNDRADNADRASGFHGAQSGCNGTEKQAQLLTLAGRQRWPVFLPFSRWREKVARSAG